MKDRDEITRIDDPVRKAHKRKTVSALIPIMGVFLFFTPVANLFAFDGVSTKVSSLVVFVFLVWGGLILAAFLAARNAFDPSGRD